MNRCECFNFYARVHAHTYTHAVFKELVCSACGRHLNWEHERVMVHGRHYLLTCEVSPCSSASGRVVIGL